MKIPNDILNSDIDLFNTELVREIYLFFKFSENDVYRSYVINYFLTNIREEHPAITWNALHNIITSYIRPTGAESEDNIEEEKKVVRALLKDYFPNIVFFLSIFPSKFEKENCLEAFIYELYFHKLLLAYFAHESDESYSALIEALLKCTKDFVKKGVKLNNNDICDVMLICKNYPYLPFFNEDCTSEKIVFENGKGTEAWLLHLLSINLDVQYSEFPNYNASYACRFLKSSVKIIYPSIYEKLLTIFCLKQLQYSN